MADLSRLLASCTAVALASMPAGCSKENNVDASTTNNFTTINNTTVIVGAEGGEIASPGGATAYIPAGALTEPTTVNIGEAVAGTYPDLDGFEPAGAVFAFEPHGLAFLKDVVLTVPHEGGEQAGIVLVTAQPDNGWTTATVSLGTDSFLQTVTRHFSFYASATVQSSTDGGLADSGPDSGPTSTAEELFASQCTAPGLREQAVPFFFAGSASSSGVLQDTGWEPASFHEIQMRTVLRVPASVEVGVAGILRVSWPPTLNVTVETDVQGGQAAVTLAPECTSAMIKLDITSGGNPVVFEGPLPFVPQVDFTLSDSKTFEAWGFDGLVAPLAQTVDDPVTVFQINLLGLAGIPDEVSEGGASLRLKGDMQATYSTAKVQLDGHAVTDGPIHLVPAGPLGASTEFALTGEGNMSGSAIVHAEFEAYVEVPDGVRTLPLYGLPLNSGEPEEWFPSSVGLGTGSLHIPLPNVEAPQDTLDLGKTAAHSPREGVVTLTNTGEARACVAVDVSGTDAGAFEVLNPGLMIEPGQSAQLGVRVTPSRAGVHTASLRVVTSNPDADVYTVSLSVDAE
jgi:hypothetical protein